MRISNKVFVPSEEGVKRTVKYMKKHSRRFLKKEDAGGSIGSRTWKMIKNIVRLLIPYLENLFCFGVFFMLNNRAVSSAYYNKLDFYLLYVPFVCNRIWAATGDFFSAACRGWILFPTDV